jgi:thiol-disulfide isomerase/thioredoxin
MDRLQTLSGVWTLAFALVGIIACDEPQSAQPPAASGRVVAVSAKDESSTSEFCDVLKPAASAPTFSYPPLDAPAPPATGAWRWLNVWASWCAPCVEELPLIHKLRTALDGAGQKVDLVLLSVDGEAAAMTAFQATHPDAKGSLRLSDMAALEGFLTSVGLDAGATLPVHLFIDPAGKVRCARTGAVKDSDLPSIKKLLAP